MKSTEEFKKEFLINPDITFFNHGSFGACPKAVFEQYQEWQQLLEWQPVEFMIRRFGERLHDAREVLATYINSDKDSIVYIPNSTHGVNIAARSIPLQPGDEIISTNHEYGACDKLWEYLCNLHGSTYKPVELSLPVHSHEEIVETIWSAISEKTKVLFLSEITSPTAIHLPVKELCRRAREHGIITIIDASHSPGQIGIDINDLQPDFYTANCHKWLCSPKSAGFLYAAPHVQHLVQPLTVSWGWNATEFEHMSKSESPFVRSLEWMGTVDISAYLSVPAAIEYQHKNHWNKVLTRCHTLTESTTDLLCEVEGVERLNQTTSTDGKPINITTWENSWYVQMATVRLPPCDVVELKHRLLRNHAIEVVVQEWNNIACLRFSVQAYIGEEDTMKLVEAFKEELPLCQK